MHVTFSDGEFLTLRFIVMYCEILDIENTTHENSATKVI